MPHYDQLFAAVYTAPENDDARRVLADWLQARGDPRGEFIALQFVEAPTETQLERISELLELHRESWLAPLGPGVRDARFERGFAVSVWLDLDGSNELLEHLERPAWACVRELEIHAMTPAVDHAIGFLAYQRHQQDRGRTVSLERIEVGPVRCGHAHRWYVVHKTFGWATVVVQLEHAPRFELGFALDPAAEPGSAPASQLEVVFDDSVGPCISALNHIMYRLTPLSIASIRLLATPGWEDRGEAILGLNTDYFRGLDRVEVAASLSNELPAELPPGWRTVEDPPTCPCFEPEATAAHFESRAIGVDTVHGRFGEVTALRCRSCARHWLRYFVEYESVSHSGRHFRGPIDPFHARTLEAHDALEFLTGLPRTIFGGSFYGGRRAWSATPPYVDG